MNNSTSANTKRETLRHTQLFKIVLHRGVSIKIIIWHLFRNSFSCKGIGMYNLIKTASFTLLNSNGEMTYNPCPKGGFMPGKKKPTVKNFTFRFLFFAGNKSFEIDKSRGLRPINLIWIARVTL